MRTDFTRKMFVCAIALVTTAACAHGARPRTLASRLVHGRPSPEAAPMPRPDVGTWIEKVREIQASARPAPRLPVLTVEGTDPALQQTLTRLATSSTSVNQVAAAFAYYRAGILDTAQDHLAEALRLDHSDPAAYDLRARIWRDWGFPAMAVADAHRAVYYAPRSPEARNTLGTVFLALGLTQEARSAYLKAAELDARASYAWSNVCHLSVLEGDLTSGEQACRRALEIDPNLANARRNLDRIQAIKTYAGTQGERRP